MANERLKILSEKALNTPELPGVYIMRDAKKQIIYIGKAKILKNRVSQYFREGERHEPKVQKMVDNVFDFDYVVCTSEFEALILECSLIKQNQPKYNILLKDDKGYHYIKITSGPWPRITAEKQKIDDNAQYLGRTTPALPYRAPLRRSTAFLNCRLAIAILKRNAKKAGRALIIR